MKNVSDGKIVLECSHHQDNRGEKNDSEAGNSGATCRLTQPFRARSLVHECQDASQKRIATEGQREQERKTADLRHGGVLRISFQKPCTEATKNSGSSWFREFAGFQNW